MNVDQDLKEVNQHLDTQVIYNNIIVDIIQNIASKKLSQFTKDSQLMMPLFTTINIFLLNSVEQFYFKQLIGWETKRTDINPLYPALHGFFDSFKIQLFAQSASGFELDGVTMSALNLISLPLGAIIESVLLKREVKIYTMLSIFLIMFGVYIISSFKFNELSLNESTNFTNSLNFNVKKDGYHQGLDMKPSKFEFIDDSFIYNSREDLIHYGNVKSKNYITKSAEGMKLSDQTLKEGKTDQNQQQNKEQISHALNNMFKQLKKNDYKKELNFKQKTSIDLLKELTKASSEQNQHTVKLNKITARIIGVILEMINLQISHITFKYVEQSTTNFLWLSNTWCTIFISIQGVIGTQYQYSINPNMLVAIQTRYSQQLSAFFVSDDFNLSQMSKYAWLTTFAEKFSTYQYLKKAQKSVINTKINCWGEVISPILFSLDVIMQEYKKELNIITIVGIIFIIVGIKLNDIVSLRTKKQNKIGKALSKKNSNGNNLDFS